MPFSYYNDVSADLSIPQMANDILRAAYAKPNLARPEICPIININKLHVKQPSLGRLVVNMGVREFESIGVQTPNTDSKIVELLFDSIAVAVSDESTIENYYGDSLRLIAEENGRALAKALELWIVYAMKGNEDDDNFPLRIEAHVDPANPIDIPLDLMKCANLWHHHVVPHTIQLLGDWEPSAVCMHPALWAHLQPLFNGAVSSLGGANTPYEWMDNKIPGFDCPVITSTYLDVQKIYVVSADAAAMRCYQYDTMRPITQYNPAIRSNVMYTGIYRTVASGFRMATKTTWSPKGNETQATQRGNAGIVEITLSGAFLGTFEPDNARDGLEGVDWANTINAATKRDITEFAGKYIANKVTAQAPKETIDKMKTMFDAVKPEKVDA